MGSDGLPPVTALCGPPGPPPAMSVQGVFSVPKINKNAPPPPPGVPPQHLAAEDLSGPQLDRRAEGLKEKLTSGPLPPVGPPPQHLRQVQQPTAASSSTREKVDKFGIPLTVDTTDAENMRCNN